jgi:acyl-CoA thioesterase II
VRIVGDVDIRNPDEVGPPELRLWTRFGTAPDDPLISQALLAYAADGFLMGTAMRPHRGVGQSQVHSVISTAVISHTITFHEQFRASDWILLDHESPYAGRSITYGRANAFDLTGRLVASFIQDNMVRRFAAGVTVEGAERTVF